MYELIVQKSLPEQNKKPMYAIGFLIVKCIDQTSIPVVNLKMILSLL